MKLVQKSILLAAGLLFTFQQGVFAYTTGNTEIVKVKGVYEVTNTSGGTLSAQLEILSANQEDAPYSTFLEERTSAPILEEKSLDSKGNYQQKINAGYVANNETKKTDYEYLMKVSTIDYGLDPAQTTKVGSYPSNVQVYLQPSDKIESSNSLIVQKAQDLKNSLPSTQQQNPYYLTKAIYSFTQSSLSYTYNSDFRNKGALFAYTYRVGNCEDYSSLMVALLRASNIPARTVTGYRVQKENLSTTEFDLHDEANYTRHMWVEAYINGYGWVAFDPTIVSSTKKTIQVKDYNGKAYLKDGQPVSIEIYEPLKTTVYNLFGKLTEYYIKERYDLNDHDDKVYVSRTPATFDSNWYAQKVSYSSFNPYTKLFLEGNMTYKTTPVTLSLKGTTNDGKTNTIPNESATWTTSDSNIATVDKGVVTFKGASGSLTITASYQGITTQLQTNVVVPKPEIKTITVNPSQPTTTDKVVFNLSTNVDSSTIKNIEWKNKQDTYTEGTYTVQARFQDAEGKWSDWFSKTFTVIQVKTTTLPFKEPTVNNNEVENLMINRIAQPVTVSFKDISSHWAKDSIQLSQKLQLSAGYEDSTFRPNNAITREEFVVMVARAFNLQPSNDPYPFKDSSGSWSKGYITALSKLNIVSGYQDGTFGSNKNITRSEMATLLSRLINFNEVPSYIQNNFTDINSHWAKESVQSMSSIGIIYGKTDTAFAPNDKATRAESIVMLLRMLQLNIHIKTAIQG